MFSIFFLNCASFQIFFPPEKN